MNTASSDGRLVASISLDLDNLWSYLKTYGDATWSSYPTFIPVVVPRLLELFDTFALTGTVFVVGQDTELDENVDALATITAAGHEVGNHSFRHEPWLHTYSRERIVDELERAEAGIARVTGTRPRGFRGPGYSLSPALLEVLAERGYSYDATTLPTWIGPLARAYYFRSANLSESEREIRSRLFGKARDGLRPVHAYRWKLDHQELLELPVTTMPLLRVPMHFSYVLYLHQASPAIARAYFRNALRICSLRGIGPSLLLHPLDLIDKSDAKQAAFFPGMALPAAEKRRVIDSCLREMTSRFDVRSSGAMAASMASTPLRLRQPDHD